MDDDILTVVSDIAVILREKGLKLSIAESCTGGYISNAVTDLPGASSFFQMSIICYSFEAKTSIMGISAAVVKKHGMVSEETAIAMAKAVRDMSATDISLAITGVAGPDRMEDKEPGLVYMAAATGSLIESRGMKLEGDRKEIKKAASLEALLFLRRVLDIWL